MFNQTDEQLIKKALRGNKRAWVSLINQHEKAVFNYCLRMTGNRDDAKDLMQEVFLGVFKSLENYQARSSFKSWLFKIAHFKCMDFFRRKKVDVNFDELLHQGANEDKSQATNVADLHRSGALLSQGPEEDFYQLQANQQVLALLQKLPINQRLIVELKFYSQFTFCEISEQLDISTNTAKSRLYAALSNLKLYLDSIDNHVRKGVEHG